MTLVQTVVSLDYFLPVLGLLGFSYPGREGGKALGIPFIGGKYPSGPFMGCC